MSETESIQLVTDTLELCAETLGDIVPPVYERFFELSDSGRGLMDHSDQYMRGRMFEQVIAVLMSDEHFESGGYLEWELTNHLDAYNARPDMYLAFFQALQEVVQQGASSIWSEQTALAWQTRIELIMSRVQLHGHV